MKDLKTLLFEQAHYYGETMDRIEEKHGAFNDKYYEAHSRYFAVYYVIEKADLEEEYLEWVEKKESEEN